MSNKRDDHDLDELIYSRVENFRPDVNKALSAAYDQVLRLIGEDPSREGLQRSPVRIARAMQYLTHGYQLDPNEIMNSAVFEAEHNEMVIIKDIEVYSICEHHMLPFFGQAHIAYLPKKKIVGLSKVARVVDVFARRLQVQERLTTQIVNCIQEALDPHGVAVVMECKHLCMMMRGVQKQNSITTTSAFTGHFEQLATRSEFINLIGAKLM
jgi:GTP cyclohydrolase I